jgi:ATP-dependent Clp protease protease subunit
VLTDILVKHTGQDAERVSQDCDRDHFMTAAAALDYGIIDRIVQQREDEE